MANAGADDPLVWYDRVNLVTYFLHTDHQGSVVAMTGAGAPSALNAYDEYGVPRAGNVGRFQYTGQLWLPDLGMYHYKARVYAPALGRFLQTDPVGYQDQYNLYGYVGNDPVNLVDPTGTQVLWRVSPLDSDEERDRKVQFNESATRALRGAEIEIHNNGLQILASFIPVERAVTGAAWAWRVLGLGTRLSRATRIAMAGGRHSGLLRQYSQMSATSINRSIRNLTRRIEEHREKIRNPAAYMTRESPRDPAAVQRAINDWRAEIRNYSEQRDIARDALRAQCSTGTRLC
jgi:RHS repeat-associated protein